MLGFMICLFDVFFNILVGRYVAKNQNRKINKNFEPSPFLNFMNFNYPPQPQQ